MTIIFPDDKLGMWVVYHQPELPQLHYRARLFCIDKLPAGTPTAAELAGDSLEEIRFLIEKTYPGLICLPRAEQDPPEVVETWL